MAIVRVGTTWCSLDVDETSTESEIYTITCSLHVTGKCFHLLVMVKAIEMNCINNVKFLFSKLKLKQNTKKYFNQKEHNFSHHFLFYISCIYMLSHFNNKCKKVISILSRVISQNEVFFRLRLKHDPTWWPSD